VNVASPTSTPLFIRPSPQALGSTPTSTFDPKSPQSQLTTSVPMVAVTDTLNTLENTFIPINDPIDLAHRILGLDNLSPTEVPPASFYTVGDHQAFWVGNGDLDNFRVKATLGYVTDHAYFWIEDGVRYSARDLRALADAFENQIYPTDRSFFGSEWFPGVDGDPHIYILYTHGIGDDTAGYYSSADEFPRQVNRFSNGHEMFLVSADNSPLDDKYTFGILAHEFQHTIHWYQDRNESSWVSEGFSELAVLLNNYYSGGFDALYTSQPDLQLNNWPDESQEDATPHYGASFLFFTYFLDRFGESATKALVANQDNDLNSVDSTMRQNNIVDPQTGKPITADAFFLDWAVTNYLMDPKVSDGRYAYTSYRGAPRADPTETVNSCPIANVTRDVHQYGVDYIRFRCPGSYTIHFEGSIQTPLLPQNPHSGSFTFWSNKSDESDTTLTKTFDLTNYSGPLSFSYWTWYDIEDGWDYVYLEASTDGVHWQILTTPSGTSADPQGNNYGRAYTGASGGGPSPIWINETVDLSQYAGQNLSLRFEYVTDSNFTGEGFLLDDLSIPEIGYTTDFEADNSGWQPEGWARIQNVLPQNYALALISMGDTTTVQNITLQPDITADIPFTIGSGVDNVVLVVSATTRFTRQLAPYRYSATKP
jgi:immune inhibitor A